MMGEKKGFLHMLFGEKKSSGCCNMEMIEEAENGGCADGSCNTKEEKPSFIEGAISIKILGTGCKNCATLTKNAKLAVAEMGLQANIEQVTDLAAITGYGVMSTPALVIEEKVVAYGKVLKPKEIVKIIKKVNLVNGSGFSGCCSKGSACCPSPQEKKLLIDLLYLDLTVCTRCQGAEKNLEEALAEVSGVLKAAGFTVVVNKINITSPELAEKYRFVSSPTIRINGIDIDLTVKESTCKECGDLCGNEIDCRAWEYEGVEYSEPPKPMIVNAILKTVYGERKTETAKDNDYELPENLRRFFDALKRKRD